MCGEMEHGFHLHMEHQAIHGGEFKEGICTSIPNPPIPSTSRPNSMVIKKVCRREFIPPHIVAEAISTLRGLDLRWSGPITPGERRYVEQYVLAKYPQYSRGLIGDDASAAAAADSEVVVEHRRLQTSSPPTSSSAARGAPAAAAGDVAAVRLEPSRLLDMLARKASFPGSFVSIPEIQARNRVLRRCGLADDDYLVLFAPTPRDALVLVGESYPFFRGNYYMSILASGAGADADAGGGGDCVRAFAAYKDAKVIAAPESWLDLRIKGSQLSQYFRRKCKHAPKGLFAYPVVVSGAGGEAAAAARYSLHWVSEAHRNGWHVLLDATGLAAGDRLPLSLHRPDFVTCALDDARAQPPSAATATVTCLLVRRRSFDVTSKGDN